MATDIHLDRIAINYGEARTKVGPRQRAIPPRLSVRGISRNILMKEKQAAAIAPHDTHEKAVGLLTDFVVLYFEVDSDEQEPLVFACQAEDEEHASSQCIDAYPECQIAWVKQANESEVSEIYEQFYYQQDQEQNGLSSYPIPY